VAQRPPDPGDPGSPEHTLDEALARARRHAKNALAESLEAVRALLDAAALATSGASSGEHPVFARADAWIRHTSAGLSNARGLPADLGAALADALDAEIGRWEERAHVDDDARAVLRAFLGLREMLWEVGVRPTSARSAGAQQNATPTAADADLRPRPRRVERVSVQG
jgi:hypothetical protein